MGESSVFEAACAELEKQTALDRLAARGTVRIALKSAGLDANSVDVQQMTTVLQRVLPGELERRGVADARRLCEQIASSLASTRFDATVDRAGAAARTLARLGS